MAEAAEATSIGPDRDQKFDSVIQTILLKEHLPVLLEMLHGAADKWEVIATFLNMRSGSIAAVKAEQTNAEKKLFDIIKRWLNETNPAPTAANLVYALRHPIVGENAIACKIEREFHSYSSMPPQRSSSSLAAHMVEQSSYCALSSPLSMAFKETTLQLEDASTQQRSKKSLNDSHLRASVDGDNQQAYECGCGKKCSLTDIISGKCGLPKSKGGLFPTLAAKNLSESDRKLLSGEVTIQFHQISKKYASLTSSIRASLKRQGITPAQLAEKLMDLEGFVPLRHHHDHEGAKHRLLEDRESEFSRANSIEEIFRILKDYCSFYNHEIIEYIVEELGTKDDKARLEKYREDFTEYCRRSVFECPFSSGSEKSSHFVDLVMKVDSAIEQYTMKAVDLFHTQVAKVLQITKYTLHLWSVEEGCLKMTFCIPRFLKTVILPLNAEQRRDLKRLRVVKLDCDGVCQPLSEPEPERGISSIQESRFEPKRRPQGHESVNESGECLDFKLLGQCKFGNVCKYRHVQPITNRVEGYVSFPMQHSMIDDWSPVGQKGHSPSRKGYIVVHSDRDPMKEVMVVAEDEDALEYARRVISKKSETTFPKEKQSCAKLRLLGYCDNDQCPYQHQGVVPVKNPKRTYIQHPLGRSATLKKFINCVGYTKKKECYLTLPSDRHPEKEILVYAETDEALEYAKTQIPVIMGQTYSSYSSDEDLSKIAKSNEELLDLIQQWKQEESKRDIVMVVAGKSGSGKSTLINNFLTLDSSKAAESRLHPTSVTREVKRYDGEVNGVLVRAVDMPGLHARRHERDTETEIVAALSHVTDGNADILIYCVSLTQRLDSIDERNIGTLIKAFGKKIWHNAIFVLTHADSVLEDENSDLDELVAAFTKELQEILRDCEINICIKPCHSSEFSIPDISLETNVEAPDTFGELQIEIVAIPSGKRPNLPPGWRESLLAQVISVCQSRAISKLTQLEGMSWEKIKKKLKRGAKVGAVAGAIGFASGAAVGTGIGAGIGAIVGAVLTAPIGGVGAVPTAAGGAAVGALVGSLSGGGGIGTLAALAGGIGSARSDELFKDIAFYYRVQKKLEELQKGLEESS